MQKMHPRYTKNRIETQLHACWNNYHLPQKPKKA